MLTYNRSLNLEYIIAFIVEMGKKQKKNQTEIPAPEHYEVFISGLPYEATEKDIETFFDFASKPRIKLPKYQDTGRCLGYGHV
jgi:RNA recognition motif-containing protein